jgi:hypothetical protein
MNIALNQTNYTDNKSIVIKYHENLKKSGKIRDIDFIRRLAENNKIRFVETEEEIENYITTITNLKNALNTVMGEDWDFFLAPRFERSTYLYEYELRVQLYFPEATLKNENGEQHTITDAILMFRLLPSNINMSALNTSAVSPISRSTDPFNMLYFNKEVQNSYYKPFEIRLTRASLSRVEYIKNYQHSHVNSQRTPFYLGNYCLGTHYINNILSDMFETANNNSCITEDDFTVFELSLQYMITVESIAGRPYISFDCLLQEINTQNFEEVSDTYSYSQNMPYRIFTDVFRHKYMFSREKQERLLNCFEICGEGIKIIDTLTFSTLIKEILLTDRIPFNTELSMFISFSPLKDSLIKPVTNSIETNQKILQKVSVNTNGIPYTYIRDKKLEFRITSEEIDLEDESNLSIDQFWIHPQCINEIKKVLETKINNNYVKYKDQQRNSN